MILYPVLSLRVVPDLFFYRHIPCRWSVSSGSSWSSFCNRADDASSGRQAAVQYSFSRNISRNEKPPYPLPCAGFRKGGVAKCRRIVAKCRSEKPCLFLAARGIKAIMLIFFICCKMSKQKTASMARPSWDCRYFDCFFCFPLLSSALPSPGSPTPIFFTGRIIVTLSDFMLKPSIMFIL